MSAKLNDRPLPSLAQWLGDGARGAEFEEWVRETVYGERHIANDVERATLRVLRTMAIACVEACNLEAAQGREPSETVTILARVAGVAAMCAVLSVLDDERNPPLRRIARSLVDDFKHGAMTIVESQETGADDQRSVP